MSQGIFGVIQWIIRIFIESNSYDLLLIQYGRMLIFIYYQSIWSLNLSRIRARSIKLDSKFELNNAVDLILKNL